MENPFIVRTESGARVTEPLSAGGIPLGAIEGSKYVETPAHLNQGDIIVMATDGVTEARSGGSFFGIDGLTGLASRIKDISSLVQIGQTFVSAARNYAGGRLNDDACVLLARMQ